MRRLVVGLSALVLSGCASVAANESGGVVEGVASAKQALAKAEAHCATLGKGAKSTSYDGWANTMTFECVSR